MQLRSVMETGQPIIGGEVDAKTPAHGEQIRNFQHNYFPVESDNGTIVGVSCVVEDITDRKRAEVALVEAKDHLEAANKDLESKVAQLQIRNTELQAYDHTIAHNLRTPLAASIRFLEFLTSYKCDNLTEEQHHLVAQALAMLESSGDTINALLMLSADSYDSLKPEPIDMAKLVAEALRQLAGEQASAQGTANVPETWLPAAGYGPWVGQVWLNYLSNAFKHCPPPVELELGCSPEGQNKVKFWVQDNGISLTSDERKQLFLPFSRVHRELYGGHGLGLTVVSRIIGNLGGEVGAEIPEAGGNRFFFTLPAAGDLSV
jgi:two-component system sensor histidine kinase/response regulator